MFDPAGVSAELLVITTRLLWPLTSVVYFQPKRCIKMSERNQSKIEDTIEEFTMASLSDVE